MTMNEGFDQGGMRDTDQTVTTRVQEAAGQTAEQARQAANSLGQQAKSAIDVRKDSAANELNSVANAIWQTSQQLRDQGQDGSAQYTERIAAQLDHFSSYLQAHNVDNFVQDAERFAHRQPQLFLGGAFTLGLLVARFLKSSQRRASNYGNQWNQNQQWGQGQQWGGSSTGGSYTSTYEDSQARGTSGYTSPQRGSGAEMSGYGRSMGGAVDQDPEVSGE